MSSTQSAADAVKEYIDGQKQKSLLRFITCGSVDDGKSTLIGRLLYESQLLFEDQIESLKAVSKRDGTQGEDIDFALLVDGLAAEREQGITIDVAYRFFNTEARKFIVIDTPGHEQYTRNMATGASQAQLAVLMVDARHGLTTQTKRHSYLVSLLGIKNLVVAINKMDLVDYSQDRYKEIVEEYREFAKLINVTEFTSIPMSALKGDNVIETSPKTPWYSGPALIEHLNTVNISASATEQPFRMPVQWVNRPNLDFRGFAGRVISGQVKPGDEITIMPSGLKSTLAEISTFDGPLDSVQPDESVTLKLSTEVDVSRGDILCKTGEKLPKISDRSIVKLLWMGNENLKIGATYRLRVGTQTVNASITQIRSVINVNTLETRNGEALELNEIAECVLGTERPICFDRYVDNRDLGGFILIDKFTNGTVGMGIIEKPVLEDVYDKRPQEISVGREQRSQLKLQTPFTLWFTGIKHSGKTLVADALETLFVERGNHSFILEPENTSTGICDDLRDDRSDQLESTRRVAHTAKLMNDAGIIVMSCLQSPLSFERRMARGIISNESFVEIFMDTPLDVSVALDKSGYYDKAQRGEIRNVPGVDMRYEDPKFPDLTFSLQKNSPNEAAIEIMDYLIKRGLIQ